MPYGTESKSRNADFISIARRAIRNPRARRARQTYEPSGPSGPVHLKNLSRPKGAGPLRGPLQRESVSLVSRLVQPAGDVVIGLGELVDHNVHGGTDGGGVEVFRTGGEGDVQEYIFIGADGIFHDGMVGIEVVQEGKEGLSGGALGGSAQMDPEEGVHAVVRDDSGHQLMMFPGGNGSHENDGVVGIMGFLAAEEIEPFVFHVFFKHISFYIFGAVSLGKRNGIVRHRTPFCAASALSGSSLVRTAGFHWYETGLSQCIGAFPVMVNGMMIFVLYRKQGE